jgi:hypothetical protein
MNYFWEQVRETMEQGAKALKDFSAIVSDKTQEMMTLGQLKLRHFNMNREVSNKFTAMGSTAYQILTTTKIDVYTDGTILQLIHDVEALQKAIAAIEIEIEQVRDNNYDRPAVAKPAVIMDEKVTPPPVKKKASTSKTPRTTKPRAPRKKPE